MTPPIDRTEIHDRLRQLTEIGIALTAERDLERLLERILFEARRLTGAEAGTLYVRKANVLRFTVVQNDAKPRLNVAPRAPLDFEPVTVDSSSVAGYVARTGEPVRIDDVRTLSNEAPVRFNPSIDLRTGYETRSMMVVPMTSPAGEVIGVLQLINARAPDGRLGPFDPALTDLVLSLSSQAAVALQNAQLAERLRKAYEETVFRLAAAAELRDKETGEHVRRVGLFSHALALRLGLGETRAEDLKLASPLHDVGKIAIPDAILQKPGALTALEREEMQRHTIYGAQLLEGSDLPPLRLAREIALCHHERWDGRGYPHGLQGETIPLSARIVAVVDVFDALSSRRVYKQALPIERCYAHLREGSGTQFDPQIVEAFCELETEVEAIRKRYPDPPEA